MYRELSHHLELGSGARRLLRPEISWADWVMY
jgi:hypothetical protein